MRLPRLAALVAPALACAGAPRTSASRVEVWDYARWSSARTAADSSRHVAGDTAIYFTLDSAAAARAGRSVAEWRAARDSLQSAVDTLGVALVAVFGQMLRDSAAARRDTALARRIDSLLSEPRTPRVPEPRWRRMRRDMPVRTVGRAECGYGYSSVRPEAPGAAPAASFELRLGCAGRGGPWPAHGTLEIQAPLANGWRVHATRLVPVADAPAAGHAELLDAPQPGDTAVRVRVRLRADTAVTVRARVRVEVRGPAGTDPYPRYVPPPRTG